MTHVNSHVYELIQLTDSHLYRDPAGRLQGLATLDSLQQVVSAALSDSVSYAAVLATGDLSQDGSPESYQAFLSEVARFRAPVRWCPGNHDDARQMAACPDAGTLSAPELRLGNWSILMLDSSVPGAVHGELDAATLQQLEQRLAASPERHYLIGLHHPPVAVGSAWIDRIGLQAPEAFLELLSRHACVRGLVFGHVHQDFLLARQGITYLATPSTCVQFAAGSPGFGLAPLAPGYRRLRLFEDGHFETEVVRLKHFDASVLQDTGGY